MFDLSCDVQQLQALTEERHSLSVEISVLLDTLRENSDVQQLNLARRLTDLRVKFADFVKRLFRFKRSPATHIFLLMISSELRNHKPYALPVQCLPYAGMKEVDIHCLINSLIQEMVTRNDCQRYVPFLTLNEFLCFSVLHRFITGFVSNGEFNYMRTNSFVRPLSILQLRSDARKAYAGLGEKTLRAMLTPLGMPLY